MKCRSFMSKPMWQTRVVLQDLVEGLLREVDQVHLVDRDDHVLDAQQRDDKRVPLGLRHHAVAGIDENDRQVAGARAGGHVAGVLLVTRRVGDDELALGGREIAISHVDRDALLTLGLQPVGEQRGIEIAAGGADRGRIFLDRGELILVDHLRVVQQPADQRRLAVVDRAARQKPQQLLVLMLLEVSVNVGGD